MKYKDEPDEIWRPIAGYEDRYLVSNIGRVKSISRISSCGRQLKEKILKGSMTTKGYRSVNLLKDEKIRFFTIHRLVANAFIPNAENKSCINHKDGDKLNNNADNLEWCDYSYNNKHALDNHLRKPAWQGKFNSEHPRSTKVIQYTKGMVKVKEWNSIREASKSIGVLESAICSCCRGNLKTTGGYVWRYAKCV